MTDAMGKSSGHSRLQSQRKVNLERQIRPPTERLVEASVATGVRQAYDRVTDEDAHVGAAAGRAGCRVQGGMRLCLG